MRYRLAPTCGARLIRRARRNATNGGCSTITTRATRPPPTPNMNGIPERRSQMKSYGLAALLLLLASGASAQSSSDSWSDLKKQMFKDASIAEDATFVSLQAPPRAEDAALTPVTMSVHMPAGDHRRVAKLSLV